MSTERKVAVVTGGNKGIGLAIVRGLCKGFDGDIYLTARNKNLGLTAINNLENEGITVKFFCLDIRNDEQLKQLSEELKKDYGGLDLLINNAAIAYKRNSTVPFSMQVKDTMETNFYSTLRICEILFPIMKSHGRVVHLSSRVGVMAFNKSSEEIKNEFKNAKSVSEVKNLVGRFITAAEEGNHIIKGWPTMAYGISKLALTCVTRIQQRELENVGVEGILINSTCPGFVNTDMSSHKGFLTPEEGAETPLYCALLPKNTKSPKGDFVVAKQIVDWSNSPNYYLALQALSRVPSFAFNRFCSLI